jgi:hypothetical protein
MLRIVGAIDVTGPEVDLAAGAQPQAAQTAETDHGENEDEDHRCG